MKNNKKDAFFIAKLGKPQDIKLSQGFSLDIFLLKSLIRDYYKLTDTCYIFKKKLYTDLRVIFPSYGTVFSSVTSNSSIAILSDYPTPQSILDASKDKILEILISKF
ncbi:IS110 family transposase [Clostridium algidicarnis]|uniref:IS110 family transposase n=1 Tax=Clostridium algidicarnis TaxID=37659 RepID=UPI001C0E735B|nr:IS110 family transposase [Clostridium algidicarnis]MBU3228919.1 IS110 family transposase [Clostridium algidicarnis]MBU3252463.1 IS110 family transposase [Clostridium algidicarnis]